MDECIPAFLVDFENITTEKFGKSIKKVVPSMQSMGQVLEYLKEKDISELSFEAHNWVARKRNLSETLAGMYSHFAEYCLNS